MIPNRRGLLAGLTGLSFLAPTVARAAPRWAPESMDAILQDVFEAHRPVGLAAATITTDGLSWSGAQGLRRLGLPFAVTTADVWHLGSNTKAMTCAVLARLVDSGRARWSMPLPEAFPAERIHEGWQGVTLDDFMHHRSGLSDRSVMDLSWFMAARSDARSLREQRSEIVSRALAAPPAGVPGQFAYGNANYVVVGSAIERLTGASWEDAMRAELFAPLGIESAGFGAPAAGADGSGNAWGHRLEGERRLPLSPDHPGADNPAALGPAGTVHMTLTDYGRFLSAIMKPGWLSAQALARLITPFPGAPPAYACGWAVSTRSWGGVDGPGPVLAHDGSNTLWYCTAAIAPEREIALVAVTNEAAAGARACQAMIGRMAQTLIAEDGVHR